MHFLVVVEHFHMYDTYMHITAPESANQTDRQEKSRIGGFRPWLFMLIFSNCIHCSVVLTEQNNCSKKLESNIGTV